MLSRVETPNPSPSSTPTFGIYQRELDPRTSVIAVEGELDLATAPRLKWMLVDALELGHSQLIVDLSLTTFLDSTALGVLVGLKRSLDAGASLAIVCERPEVMKIFEFSGMDGAFPLFPTLDGALAYTRGHAGRTG
jgi:anti-sigma B factor antagonist